MLRTILSGDTPRSRILAALLLVILACLAFGPFLFDGVRAFITLASIGVFIVVVASYDLMLGYTHVVSFAHTMFFGIGAYSVAIVSTAMGPGFDALAVAVLCAIATSAVLALLLGLLSLRVQALFFALVTLAVAFAFVTLVAQMYQLTGGTDGLLVRGPKTLGPLWQPLETPVYGFDIPAFVATLASDPGKAIDAATFKLRFSGLTLMYYLSFVICLGLFLFLLRVVNSPFGRVLQAIRENEFRARALGYRTVLYRTAVVVLGAVIAALAGVLFALLTGYITPKSTLDFELMVFILLMCVIGGMGTLYGAVIGTALFILAQNYLQDLLRLLGDQLPADGWLAELVAPERWLLWFGLLFVLSVYFFPAGIVGQLRKKAATRTSESLQNN